MPHIPQPDDLLDRLRAWAARQPLVRALVLESSRANPDATLDALSDYDVLLVVAELTTFLRDEPWLSALDDPLVTFRDAKTVRDSETYMRLVLYQDGTKVDYAIWPADLLRQVVADQRLPDLLDWGYRVLLDKDGLTAGLPAPTRRAHIPPRPTAEEYQALVEEFWWETSYVAKNLWRDDVLHAKYSLEVVMKQELLVRMLEWRVEVDHDWTWKPGPVGRGLTRHLPPALWPALAATYVGTDLAQNWDALFATTDLFRQVASDVARALGYAYPIDLDRRMTVYLRGVRDLPR
jgi:aminoglycoside 6-adenylyltransferase